MGISTNSTAAIAGSSGLSTREPAVIPTLLQDGFNAIERLHNNLCGIDLALDRMAGDAPRKTHGGDAPSVDPSNVVGALTALVNRLRELGADADQSLERLNRVV